MVVLVNCNVLLKIFEMLKMVVRKSGVTTDVEVEFGKRGKLVDGNLLRGLKLKKKNVKRATLNVCITESFNNVFVSVIDPETGGVVFKCSGGLIGYKGPRRSSHVCALKVGEHVSGWLKKLVNELSSKGIELSVDIVLKTVFTGKVQSVLRGLCYSFSLYSNLHYDYQPAHNGVRQKKPRRV